MTDYWKNRFIKSTKDVFDSDEEYVKEIFKIYEKTIEDIDGEIFKLLSSMEDVSMAEAKKLLNKYEIRSFKSGLDEFRKASKGFISLDIEQELDIVSRRVRISRLQAMQVSMKSKVASLLNKEQKKLFAHLSNKFTSSYYKDLYELQRITGYKNINSLSKDFVNNILNTSWTSDGENFSDRIWKRKDKLLNTLDTELRQGLITGKRPDEITKAISNKLEVSRTNAKRLVLTESSAVHSQSRKAMYERMGVEKYEVVATLDLRTSDICRKLDGKVFDVKDYERGITAPPFHVYCRSTTVPYYNDDIQAEIENTRMARDPETGKSFRVENLTYNEWYNKYVVNSDPNDYNISEHTFGKTKKFKNFEDFEEFIGMDNLFDFEDSVSKDEAISIAFYSHTGDKQINSILRSGIADYDIKSYVQDLDNIISRFEVPEDVSLYRGSNLDFLYREFNINNLEDLLGKSYIDKGYTSTSIILDNAFLNKDAVFEIKLPGGKGRGAFISSFSRHFDELEFLLKRNTKFKIVDIREWYNPRQKKNVSYIVLEVCDV
ncbi:minor capsid protein [Peptoniphilus sp.]|uniref:minor capsid protein n=1 Tax=Peptoniphilus sp. TaxID=1971214 RepID=UPI002A828DD0|nr:minor capsid protein [Peptoniphilus sp.]MDY3902441.1 minor capsid protein [Peptoniphilus sp.]